MNYKEKLEKYLTIGKNNQIVNKEQSMISKADDSLIYSFTNKSPTETQNSVNFSFVEKEDQYKYRLKEKEKFALTDSLGIQINNYKRTVQSCLNTDSVNHTNINYNLKKFLPESDHSSTSRLLKKYEHLLPTNDYYRKFDRNEFDTKNKIHEYKKSRESVSPNIKNLNIDSDFNPPMKIEELLNKDKKNKSNQNSRKNNKKNKKIINYNTSIFYEIFIREEVTTTNKKFKENKSQFSDQHSDMKNDSDDPTNSLRDNEIKNFNKFLKNSNGFIPPEMEWYCLDFYENTNKLENTKKQFLSGEI